MIDTDEEQKIRFLKKIGSVPCNFNPKATHDTWTWEVVG